MGNATRSGDRDWSRGRDSAGERGPSDDRDPTDDRGPIADRGASGDREPVVVDASVVVKWYVPERDHEAARAVRDAYLDGVVDLLAPSLLPFEVVNALRYADLFDDEQLEGAAATLPDYGIEFVPFRRLDAVPAAATTADTSVYDAAYLALAAARDCRLYTADERLVATVEATPYASHVEHVREADGEHDSN